MVVCGNAVESFSVGNPYSFVISKLLTLNTSLVFYFSSVKINDFFMSKDASEATDGQEAGFQKTPVSVH